LLSDGPLVTTSGQVISGAGSPGQQPWMGSLLRSIWSPFITTCCTGAVFTVRGRMESTVPARGSRLKASFRPRGGSGWRRKARSSPTSRSSAPVVRGLPPSVTPMATRFTVPNRLARQGMSDFVPSALMTFSNSTAGPPVASSRVQISVISSSVETGSVTRTSSPDFSRSAMKSRSER
jgi:hypothetical protein